MVVVQLRNVSDERKLMKSKKYTKANLKASQAVMDLVFALRELKCQPTIRDLVKLARRIKEG